MALSGSVGKCLHSHHFGLVVSDVSLQSGHSLRLGMGRGLELWLGMGRGVDLWLGMGRGVKLWLGMGRGVEVVAYHGLAWLRTRYGARTGGSAIPRWRSAQLHFTKPTNTDRKPIANPSFVTLSLITTVTLALILVPGATSAEGSCSRELDALPGRSLCPSAPAGLHTQPWSW